MESNHKHIISDTETKSLSSASMDRVNTIISRYPAERKKSALIPILHVVQDEFGGWLSSKSMDYVASMLNLKPVEVYEVASFYSMFNMRPVGKHVLEVCRTGPCCLNGAENIIDYIKQKLNIEEGQTTDDGLFTLKPVECLASCGTAPMMQIGKHYHENLTPASIDLLLENLRNKSTTV